MSDQPVPEYTINLYSDERPLTAGSSGRYRAELLRGDRTLARESVDYPYQGVERTVAHLVSILAHDRARTERRKTPRLTETPRLKAASE